LESTDLYTHPSEADSKYLLERFNRYWSVELERKKNGHSPRLLLVWLKCFWWRIIAQGLLQFTEVAIIVLQSVIIGYLSDYFVIEDPSPVETRDAYLFAMGLTLLSLINTLIHGMGYHTAFKVAILTRNLFTAVIYQKVKNTKTRV
jgi:ATP-binding cassette subfamily C (CFTR/MRP) protein 4